MKQVLIITAITFLASCGGGGSTEGGNGKVSQLKTELDGLKKQRDGLNEKIIALEERLKVADPTAAGADNAKLVQVTVLQPQNFEHFIDLQGRITTENIYYVTPRGMGGQVKAIYVKQGDNVKKGQLLIKLDDAVIRQQKATLQTQLNYARDLYNRQQNIWKEGIGTEVQVLNARNAVENLEKQMSVLDNEPLWFVTDIVCRLPMVPSMES